MSTKPNRWLIAAVVIMGALPVSCALPVAWDVATSNEPTKLFLRQRSGESVSGTVLGVTIGDPWSRADSALRQRFTPRYVRWEEDHPLKPGETPIRNGCPFGNEWAGGKCAGESPLLSGETEAMYIDGSWRGGAVTLHLFDGKVRSIKWSYTGPYYIDA